MKKHVLRNARALRDRLTNEKRHRDAQIVQDLCRAAESSETLNKVLHRDLAALKERT